MISSLVHWLFAVPVLAFAVAIVCGIAASREAISIRKGKLVFLASVFGGVGAGLLGGVPLLLQSQLPLISGEGIIESVSANSRLHSISIRVSSGERLALKALDRSPWFRAQEHVRLQYQAYTGVIMRAQFLAPDGRVEGSFRSTSFIGSYALLAVGALIIISRSEERRVGKECRSRWSPYH